MSLSTFESSVKLIDAPQQNVYAMLSDLNNLEKAKEYLPADKLTDLTFDRDSVSVSVPPVGSVLLRIIEREEPKTIKFATEQSPIPMNLWIQLLPASETTTKIKLTARAELNPLFRGMIAGPLQQGLDKIADALTKVQYCPRTPETTDTNL